MKIFFLKISPCCKPRRSHDQTRNNRQTMWNFGTAHFPNFAKNVFVAVDLWTFCQIFVQFHPIFMGNGYTEIKPWFWSHWCYLLQIKSGHCNRDNTLYLNAKQLILHTHLHSTTPPPHSFSSYQLQRSKMNSKKQSSNTIITLFSPHRRRTHLLHRRKIPTRWWFCYGILDYMTKWHLFF